MAKYHKKNWRWQLIVQKVFESSKVRLSQQEIKSIFETNDTNKSNELKYKDFKKIFIDKKIFQNEKKIQGNVIRVLFKVGWTQYRKTGFY